MPFDWKEYLDLAKLLQNQKRNGYSQEAEFRSAVSRAYYAAFCHARNFIRNYEDFIPSNNADDHFSVREYLRQQRKFDIADNLNALRRWRNRCDYEDIVENLSDLLIDALKNAQEVIDKLK